jgi:ATP-dependent Clp protease ATP-binding subunit ClpX
MMNVENENQCSMCKKSVSKLKIYNLAKKTYRLCQTCGKAFESGMDLMNQENNLNSYINDLNDIKDPEILAKIRKEIREDIDPIYKDQFANLINFDFTPSQIYDKLNQFIVGQSEAKKKMSTAVRRHYKRISLRIRENYDDKFNSKSITANQIPKENILLIGPTGSGKTYTCRILSDIVSTPFWSASMTGFTEDGYVGESVENLLSSLIREAGHFLPLAECGMIFMDEIDKKAMKNAGNPSISRDVSGEGVQSAILDMIDTNGAVMNVGLTMGNRKHSQRYTEKLNTRDIMFIMGGAFPGLVDIVKKRVKSNKKIGFNANVNLSSFDKQLYDNELLHQVLPEDVVEYGFLPELVGRFGLMTVLDPLTKDDMKIILLDIKNAIIPQQQILAGIEGFAIEFTEEAIDKIIDKAVNSGMGARRLKSIVTHTTDQIFFEMPDKTGTHNVKVLGETVDDPSVFEVN